MAAYTPLLPKTSLLSTPMKTNISSWSLPGSSLNTTPAPVAGQGFSLGFGGSVPGAGADTGGFMANANIGQNGYNLGTPSLNTEGVKTPDMGGGWMSDIGTGLKVAQVGLGVYNAMEQSKMNDFMKGYYGNEMARNKVDFNNAVDDANSRRELRAENKASAAGFAFGSDESKNRIASDMSQWGAKKFDA
jgi:hypothetical protein